MKHLAILLSLAITTASTASPTDSTKAFKFHLREEVKYEETDSSEDGTTSSLSEMALRSSLLIQDASLNSCLVSAKLIEYKPGIAPRETVLFSKNPVALNSQEHSIDDAGQLFSLYRKPHTDSTQLWGFKIPAGFTSQTIRLLPAANYEPFLALPEKAAIPIGQPFPFMLITTTDATRNYPFLMPANKGKYPANEWNQRFGLQHSFLVELTIEKAKAPLEVNEL